MKSYMFWIETVGGERIEWRRLSAAQAKSMYANTEKWLPDTVHRFGWEEVK